MVPRFVRVLVTFLLCFWQQASCQHFAYIPVDGATDLSVVPTTLTLTPSMSDSNGGQLIVQCGASSVGDEELVSMVIACVRDTHALDMARIHRVETQGAAEISAKEIQSASVSGSVDQRNVNITLTLNRANCGDTGVYYCLASTGNVNNNRNYRSWRNVNVQVSPGNITLTAQPSRVKERRVSDTLTIRCDGIVGTVKDESQVVWLWEYQNSDSNMSGTEDWQPYAGIRNSISDIHTTPPVPTTNPCYKHQISELTRRLTVDDTGRQYRCYVINRDVSNHGTEHAQVYSVGNVTGPAQVESSTRIGDAASSENQSSNCPDVRVIIGAVLAALIVIDVDITNVVICLSQRRMRVRDLFLESDSKNDELITYGMGLPSTFLTKWQADDTDMSQSLVHSVRMQELSQNIE